MKRRHPLKGLHGNGCEERNFLFVCFTLKVDITALKFARKMKSLLFKGIKVFVLLMD